jgi:cytochrome c oxidase assembly factor CtaG
MRPAAVAAFWAFGAAPALAHEGRPLAAHDLWTAWELDPLLVFPLLATGAVYAVGSRRLASGWRHLSFWLGYGSLALALLSPLHPLGEQLFSAHMTQHEILMLISAPLLVAGKPVAALLLGLPRAARRAVLDGARSRGWQAVWKRLSAPSWAWTLHAAALWGWHAPGAFQTSLSSDFWHALQHASFLSTALLLWWSLMHGRSGRMGHGAAVLYVFATALHSGILGALLTFSPTVLYPRYQGGFGLTPLEDQQLGGLLMWIPAGLLYTAFGLAFLASWLSGFERQAMEGR